MSALIDAIRQQLKAPVPPEKKHDLHDIERRRLTPTLLLTFEVYRKMAYGDEPMSRDQEDDLRRAFYAGLAEMFKLFCQVADLPEATGQRVLKTVGEELDRVPALEFPEQISAAAELFPKARPQ